MNPSFFLPHVWILFAAALISVWVARVSWRKQGVPGSKILALAMLGIGLWTLTAGIEAAVVGQPVKILWSKISYFGFTSVPVLMLSFVFVYSRQVKLRGLATFFALCFIPLVTLILAWTNELHGLIWSSFSPGSQAENVLIYHHGPWFWVYAGYVYTAGLVINLILVRMYLKSARAYRGQIFMMMLACLFPAIAGAIYLLDINPIPGLDWTPVGLLGTGAAFAWSIIRLNLLDLVPVARELLIEQIRAGIVVIDRQSRLVDINPAARRLLGLYTGNEIGKPASAILPAEIYALETEGQAEIRLESGDVKQIEVRTTNLLEVSGEMSGKLILLYDVTSRQSAEQKLREANDRLQAQVMEIQVLKEKLREESIHDPLTGLYNRRYLDEMLSREISRSNRQQKPLSFMLLDMDEFKNINDVYGHQSGDIVLIELAGLITQHTRHEDIACRFGGDEFIIILPGTNLATAVVRAEALCTEFATKKIPMRGEMITATFSLGVASYPEHGTTIDAVIRACDEALYKAKANGTNRVEVYEGG